MHRSFIIGVAVALGIGVLGGILFFRSVESSSDTRAVRGASTTQGALREARISARQFSFEPSVIRVNEGDRVRLVITNVDVAHGFSIPAFNVAGAAGPGETFTVEFIADEVGTFDFSCSVYCGAGHPQMEGQIIVS